MDTVFIRSVSVRVCVCVCEQQTAQSYQAADFKVDMHVPRDSPDTTP